MKDATNHRNVPPVPASRIDRFLPLGSMTLFTYGTLLFSEVLRALLGRVPQSWPADVGGWRVAALENRSYPGLVAAPGEIAHGRLLIGLSDDEWRLLDDFEDRKYELRQIVLLGGKDSLTYVWVDDAEVCDNAWDAGNFALVHLPAYAQRCAARHAQGQKARIEPII